VHGGTVLVHWTLARVFVEERMGGSTLSMKERLSSRGASPPSRPPPASDRRNPGRNEKADLRGLLNVEQSHQLRAIESYGWRLAFVRRPLFLEAVPVVESPDGSRRCILGVGGELEADPQLPMR
jgi:hypothetical protein